MGDKLEIDFSPEGVIEWATYSPYRIMSGFSVLEFWDILVGVKNDVQSKLGWKIQVVLTFPFAPSSPCDLGEYEINSGNMRDGSFSYRKAYELTAADNPIVVFRSGNGSDGGGSSSGSGSGSGSAASITGTQVIFAHMTLTPPGGDPITHTHPVLLCDFNPVAMGDAGVYMSRTRNLPDAIISKNKKGDVAYFRPVVLATYLNRETAEAAYAEYGEVFDDYVKNCLDCGEDCGSDGWGAFRFEDGQLHNVTPASQDDFRWPTNCTVPTSWKLFCRNDNPDLHGQVNVVDDEGTSIARLQITTDHNKSVTFTIPPCTEVHLEGTGGDGHNPSEVFELDLGGAESSSGSGSAGPAQQCTQEIQDSWELVPKTQAEWDELHTSNELLTEMGE